MEDLFKSITQIAKYAPAIPLLIYLLSFKRARLVQHWLAAAVLFSGIIEIAATLAIEYYGTNLPLYHLYVVGEFTLLSIVFSLSYEDLLPSSRLRLVILLFWILAILNILFFQSLTVYATYTRTLESIFLLTFTIRFFYLVLKEMKIKRLETTFAFWFSTGILIYFSANLLLFIYSNFIVKEDSATFYSVWAMHGVLNILLYLFYSVALWQKK